MASGNRQVQTHGCLHSRGIHDLFSSSFRTVVNLMFPPHVVALACVYLAARLTSFEQDSEPQQTDSGYRSAPELVALLSTPGSWEVKYRSHVEDLDGTSTVA